MLFKNIGMNILNFHVVNIEDEVQVIGEPMDKLYKAKLYILSSLKDISRAYCAKWSSGGY